MTFFKKLFFLNENRANSCKLYHGTGAICRDITDESKKSNSATNSVPTTERYEELLKTVEESIDEKGLYTGSVLDFFESAECSLASNDGFIEKPEKEKTREGLIRDYMKNIFKEVQ